MARQRTLHVFSDNGKSIPVSLRERDGNVAVFEAAEAIPVGVYVECSRVERSPVECTGPVERTAPDLAAGGVVGGPVLNCRPLTDPASGQRLLEISVEFSEKRNSR